MEPKMEALMRDCYGKVIEFIRDKFEDEVDEAYDFFWEEEDPEDFLSAQGYELGFVNFEDWVICDYRPRDDSGGFIDRYMEYAVPEGEQKEMLIGMRDSHLTLLEIIEVGPTSKVIDLANNKEISLDDPKFAKLRPGSVFAARLIESGGSKVMGLSVYPFGQIMKPAIIDALNAQLKRYQKKTPSADMESMLKEETYIFNMLWVSFLYKPSESKSGESKSSESN